MTIANGQNGRLLRRAVRKDGWTKARRRTFLEVLAATCNVRRAVEAAGQTSYGAYALRRRDGAFALLWNEALEQGYLRLEDELLLRALGRSSAPENPDAELGDPPPEQVGPFDPDLAIRILKMRAPRGAGRGRAAQRGATQDEVDAELMKRLDALAARLGNTA